MNKQKMNEPTLDEWRALYNAAEEFKKAACWEWMYDSDNFVVQDPETGENAIVSIMGNSGEHFAVAGYLGSEGFAALASMFSGEVSTQDPDVLFMQKCLMCSFESRDRMAPQELKLIKELGLKFRGKHAWPEFRSFEPGLYPWYIDASQCRFLTHILEQVLEVSLRCKKTKDILEHENPYAFFARVPVKKQDGSLEWEDDSVELQQYAHQYPSFSLQDEISVRRISSIKATNGLVFEVDTFLLPAPIKEESRPYYPKVCVILDHTSGMVVSLEMVKDLNEEGFKATEMLIEFIEKNGKKPARILVARDETYYLFNEICGQLGIRIERVEALDFIEEMRYELFDRMV